MRPHEAECPGRVGDRQGLLSTSLTCAFRVPCVSSQATAQPAKPERTIVVCGVPDGLLNDDIMADILMIHFQKSKNKGGDVEDVAYPTATRGVAYVTFEEKRGNLKGRK